MTKTLDQIIAHWRIRRQAWFALYYHRAVPFKDSADERATWASLAEYDNVLNDCVDAGLLERGWESKPPKSTPEDNGGFSQDYLDSRIAAPEGEGMSKTAAHQHFCSSCYGKPATKRQKPRGWWRCTDKPCTKTMATTCNVHAEAQR